MMSLQLRSRRAERFSHHRAAILFNCLGGQLGTVCWIKSICFDAIDFVYLTQKAVILITLDQASDKVAEKFANRWSNVSRRASEGMG